MPRLIAAPAVVAAAGTKPKKIEELESFSREQREAMDPYEMEERAMEIARSLTEAYMEKGGKDYEKCMSIVKQALQEMGSAFGGLFDDA